MLPEQAINHIDLPTLSFLAFRGIAGQRTVKNAYIQVIHTLPAVLDYVGAAMLLQPKTDAAFLPLIDRPPAHRDTIKTALDKGLSLMRAAGADMLFFTADQQLYNRYNVLSTHQFKYVIPVLGGMHTAHEFYSCHNCHHDDLLAYRTRMRMGEWCFFQGFTEIQNGRKALPLKKIVSPKTKKLKSEIMYR